MSCTTAAEAREQSVETDLKSIVEKSETGAILYDPSILDRVSDASFSPKSWRRAEPVRGRVRSAGRGNTLLVSDGQRELVLKHYVRGGLPGRVVHDRYLWLGEARTRAFAEWHLLAKLCEMGLPVPRPAAARYRRDNPFYTADLLTVRVPDLMPLSVRLADSPAGAGLWRDIGRVIRRFHDAGVCHADLNAYNVQVNGNGDVFLLDFDRGELHGAGNWRRGNLARLHRSLCKIKRLDPELRFDESDWRRLLEGYG